MRERLGVAAGLRGNNAFLPGRGGGGRLAEGDVTLSVQAMKPGLLTECEPAGCQRYADLLDGPVRGALARAGIGQRPPQARLDPRADGYR